MKKYLLIVLGISIVGCKSIVKTDFRDDFRGMNEKEVAVFLKKNNATSKEKSILLLTQGFKGEKIEVKQNGKSVYSSYPITNLNNRIADYFSVNNQNDLIILDNFSKKELVVTSRNSKKHKFIYVMKIHEENSVRYKITYSNTLKSAFHF